MVESIRNITKEKAVVIVPSVSAFISFLVGTTICVTMFKSKTKLKNSYRRIIFAMTTYDILLAFGTMMAPFRSNSNEFPHLHPEWGSLGNHTSAVVLTSMMIFGMIASHMYNVCLSIYYLYVIKYNYRERKMKEKVEPKLHSIPFVCATIFLITTLGSNSLNSNGTRSYWLSPYPVTCKKDPDIPCERGAIATFLNIIFGVILALCIVMNVFILLYIYVSVQRQERRADISRIRRVSVRLSNGLNSNGASRVQENDSSTARIFLSQAFYYALAFLTCFTPAIIIHTSKLVGSSNIPFALQLCSQFIRPLQGTFNVLIFTRPRVKGLRAKYDISYFTALKRVIFSGCDNIDQQNTLTPRKSSRKSTLKQQPLHKKETLTEAMAKATVSKNSAKCEVAQSTKRETFSNSRVIHVQEINEKKTLRFHDLNDIHLEESIGSEHDLDLSNDLLPQSAIVSSNDNLDTDSPLERRDDMGNDASYQKRAREVSFGADNLVIQTELDDIDDIEDTFGNEV